jgi:hypothetical protein
MGLWATQHSRISAKCRPRTKWGEAIDDVPGGLEDYHFVAALHHDKMVAPH